MAARVSPWKPTRTLLSWPSDALGTASTHCRPSASGTGLSVKSFCRPDRSLADARIAAGVLPRASACLRCVTWFRSTSYSHTVLPSATMVWANGLV